MFDLYQPFKGATPLAARLDAPRWRSGEIELPAVEASAARAAHGSTVLALLNLDPARPARVATCADLLQETPMKHISRAAAPAGSSRMAFR